MANTSAEPLQGKEDEVGLRAFWWNGTMVVLPRRHNRGSRFFNRGCSEHRFQGCQCHNRGPGTYLSFADKLPYIILHKLDVLFSALPSVCALFA